MRRAQLVEVVLGCGVVVLAVALALHGRGARPTDGVLPRHAQPAVTSTTASTTTTPTTPAQTATLAPAVLSTAQQIAGRSMTAAGTAQAVEADFETVAAVAWPGEQVFGDAQKSYSGHRILVILVSQHPAGRMRQPPPIPGRTQTPAARVGGVQSFYDETLGAGISDTVWPAGSVAPFDLARLGVVVTFEVPEQAVPTGQRLIDLSGDVVTATG